MDPVSLDEVLKREKGVKVCIPVHLYGQACQMDEILDVCSRYGVKDLRGRLPGPRRPLQGPESRHLRRRRRLQLLPDQEPRRLRGRGAVVTADRSVYDEVCKLRIYGQTEKHVHADRRVQLAPRRAAGRHPEL